MYKKTFSQKAARFFEIAGYIFLVPAIPLALLGLIPLVLVTLSGSVLGILFVVIPLISIFIGTKLLIGYYKHSRGTLAEDKIVVLWCVTFFYNLLPLLASYFWLDDKLFDVTFINWTFVIWWKIAVLVSSCALVEEYYR